MKHAVTGLTLVTAMTLSLYAMAQDAGVDCERPEAPSVPEGATASETDLLEAQQLVKGFNAEGEDYLACVKEAEATLGAEPTEEQKQEYTTLHDTMVDEMHAVADKFNQAVRAWKARTQ